MSETIYTIPINEAFEKGDGCPMCRLERQLETAALEYISGAAMMEPDVRMETNRLGFCRGHFDTLLAMKNRLALALMLQSHLEETQKLIAGLGDASGGRRLLGKKEPTSPGKALTDTAESCYVCRRVEMFFGKYLSNTVHLWKTDESFRELFSKQPEFCLRHGGMLLDMGAQTLSPAQFELLRDTVTGIMSRHAAQTQEALSGFIRSFDHRFSGQPLTPAQRSAVDDTVDFLAGGKSFS